MRKWIIVSGGVLTGVLLLNWLAPRAGLPVISFCGSTVLLPLGPVLLFAGLFCRERYAEWLIHRLGRIVLVVVGAALGGVGGFFFVVVESQDAQSQSDLALALPVAAGLLGVAMIGVGLFASGERARAWAEDLRSFVEDP